MDLEDFENNTAAAKYAEFSISPNAVSAEEDGYTLYVAGFEDGGAGMPSGAGRAGTVRWVPEPLRTPLEGLRSPPPGSGPGPRETLRLLALGSPGG